MACTSSAMAALTISWTPRLWARWTTSTPVDWRMRLMMFMGRVVAIEKAGRGYNPHRVLGENRDASP